MAQIIDEASLSDTQQEQRHLKLVALWEAIQDDAYPIVWQSRGQCDVDEPNADGQTALGVAHSYVHARDNNGETAGEMGITGLGQDPAQAVFVLEMTRPRHYQTMAAAKDAQGQKFRRAARQGDAATLRSMLRGEEKRMRQGTVYSDMSIEPVNMPLVLRPDKDGCDALMFAAHRGSAECVALLLSGGADGLARDELGDTALSRAVWARSLECVRMLIPHSHVDCKDRDGKTVLAYAASDDQEIHQTLLNASRFGARVAR